MKKNYHDLDKKEVLTYFDIDENIGVLSKEVDKRKDNFGENIINVGEDLSFWMLYFSQVKSFLNLLLLFLVFFACAVWIATNDLEYLVDSIIIFLIFLINTLIGAYQNYDSRKIAKALSSMLSSKVTVLRDSEEMEVDSKDLVCGDIVLLKGGNKVPADCYIIKSDNLKVDESILTGESIYIEKKSGKLKKNVEITQMSNMVFMNTFVVSGNSTAVVVKCGMNTEIGKIAENLNVSNKKISFLDEIDEASKTISKFAIVLIAIVSLILILRGFDVIEVFLVASALIIGSVPEGLPAIVVFLLSRSVHSLSKNKILVKDMGLLETLGSINILCTDKTGTLTTNHMEVKEFFCDFGVYDKFGDINKKSIDQISKIVSLANEVENIKEELEGEPEDIALIKFISEECNYISIRKENKIDYFEPFSSQTKCVIAKSNNKVYKKGAFEIIFDSCSYVLKAGKVVKLNSRYSEYIQKKAKSFSDNALRLIAFSYIEEDKEVFVGFAGLYDKPKDGIKDTIEKLYLANIDVKMITGDNLNTAIAVAKECGFRNPKGVAWSDIKNLGTEELRKKIIDCNVFARVLPEFKEKIVAILKESGNRVAITGDGVNDTIALRDSDVGIVMGSGSDIAKESADMVLINNDFNSIPLAIKEGRGIFSNIRKVINYLLTANLAEVIVIFVASFLGIIPFTAIQILWVNFVTDVFPALSLGLDKFPKNIMKEKPSGKDEKILNSRIKLLTLFVSIKKVILILFIYYLGYYYSGKNIVFAQTVTFTWLVLTHFIRIATIRFDEGVSIFSNRYVMTSITAVLILQLILVYTPIREFFGIESIPLDFWFYIVLLILMGVILARFISKLVDFLLKGENKHKLSRMKQR